MSLLLILTQTMIASITEKKRKLRKTRKKKRTKRVKVRRSREIAQLAVMKNLRRRVKRDIDHAVTPAIVSLPLGRL